MKAGPEFGKNEGRYMIVVRALYGLKSSGAMWHRKLAENLRDMGFRPSKADYDLWMRQRQYHWEYVAVIVDHLLVYSKEHTTIIEPLKKVYQYGLKGVGTPEYYNGADMTYDTEFKCWTISVKTYVKNVYDRISKLLEVVLKNHASPMNEGDHPKSDDTDLLFGNDISLYQMLIGCAQWAVLWDVLTSSTQPIL